MENDFMKNQKGFSLVEITIGMAVMAVVSLGFAGYMKNVALNNAKQKVREQVGILRSQALNYLKSQSICNSNVSEAFKGMTMTPSDGRIQGDDAYSEMRNTGFKNAQGDIVNDTIFKTGDLHDAGRIHISGVSYTMLNPTEIDEVASPWNRTAKLEIKVDFETCHNGGVVLFQTQEGGFSNVCPSERRKKESLVMEKLVAYEVDEDNIIVERPITESVLENGQMTYRETGETELALTCADSQDALVDAAKGYADLKSCIAMARTLILNGTSGLTECGLNIVSEAKEKIFNFTSDSPTMLRQPFSWNPGLNSNNSDSSLTKMVPNTLNAILVGGGGGGGYRGYGGKAGKYQKVPISHQFGEVSCNILVGSGGQGGAIVNGLGSKNGLMGNITSIKCNEDGVEIVDKESSGGLFGLGDIINNSCGTRGGDLVYQGQIISLGGDGGCKYQVPQSGRDGTGGGGGSGFQEEEEEEEEEEDTSPCPQWSSASWQEDGQQCGTSILQTVDHGEVIIANDSQSKGKARLKCISGSLQVIDSCCQQGCNLSWGGGSNNWQNNYSNGLISQAQKGARGGHGYVKLSYKIATASDMNNVLSKVGMSLEDLFIGIPLEPAESDGGNSNNNGSGPGCVDGISSNDCNSLEGDDRDDVDEGSTIGGTDNDHATNPGAPEPPDGVVDNGNSGGGGGDGSEFGNQPGDDPFSNDPGKEDEKTDEIGHTDQD